MGSELIGQPFDDPRYFWSRPSATGPAYNGAASTGSNLGPSNPALADAVKGRVEALKAADPGNPAPVPVDLVTTSGSDLDPHLSPAALYQVRRVARERGLDEVRVRKLVEDHVQTRLSACSAQRAIENFFKKGNLIALRELALRHTAERVDAEVRAYGRAQGIEATWAPSEQLLVAISPSPIRRSSFARHVAWRARFTRVGTRLTSSWAERASSTRLRGPASRGTSASPNSWAPKSRRCPERTQARRPCQDHRRQAGDPPPLGSAARVLRGPDRARQRRHRRLRHGRRSRTRSSACSEARKSQGSVARARCRARGRPTFDGSGFAGLRSPRAR